MIPNVDGFVVRRLRHLSEVIAEWPFFLEGLTALNNISKNQRQISPITLMNVIDDAMRTDVAGLVLHLSSKNAKPLFWGVAVNNSAPYHPPSGLVYAVYTNGKSKTVVKFALDLCEDWARENSLTELQALSPRFSGHGDFMFEKRWGFSKRSILYAKQL